MRLWNWFKSLSWIALAGVIGTAIMFAFNASKATRLTKRARAAEDRAENIIQDNTWKSLSKAEKLRKGVTLDKRKALTAKLEAERQLENIGGKDETLADIANRFNGRRVRNSPV